MNLSALPKYRVAIFCVAILLLYELYVILHKEDQITSQQGDKAVSSRLSVHRNITHAKKTEDGARRNIIVAHSKEIPTNGFHVDMIRDIATHVKWSAHESFERDLMKRCAARKYDLDSMPTASVVLCFHQTETLTRLLHTVHSIVQTAPKQLLHEVLLVADYSTAESHQEPLQNYARLAFPGLVRIHRSEKQLGLIKCRQKGVELSTGDVVITMDSHMETQKGWLEAMLYEIHKNRKTMATFMLDWMSKRDDGTWEYEYGCSRYKTVWYWKDMGFTFMEIPEELKGKIDPTETILSPVSVGHWAIERKFFFEIGGLDTGMSLLGGENIDLPIRVAMAGGRHVNVPCAHSAHCAPKGSRDYRLGHKPEINYKRLIEALFDEQYKKTIYYFNPHWTELPIGDISERRQIAQNLPFSFSHYMEYNDMEHLSPFVQTLGWDGIKNLELSKSTMESCMYIDFSTWRIKLTKCDGYDRHTSALFLTNNGEIHNSNHIIQSHLYDDSLTIANYVGVINTTGVHQWFHTKNGTIELYQAQKEASSNEIRCITAVSYKNNHGTYYKVSLRPCDPLNPYQQWAFGAYTKDYENWISKGIIPSYRPTSADMVKYYEAYKHYLKS